MAYTLHNFQVGQKLTAAHMNEMDQQIALNAAGVEAFNRQMVVDELETLSLETDGQYIILKLGDVVIAEVAVADVSDVVPCTELTLNGEGTLALDAGEEAALTWQVQPSDCNQALRFRSGDLGVASVNSQGVVTGIGVGKCTLHALCGSHSETLQAIVSQVIRPTYLPGNYIYVDSTDKYSAPAAKLEQSSGNLACVFPQEGTENIFVKAGQTVEITYNGSLDYYFRNAFAIAPLDQNGFAYTEDWNGRLCAANCKTVANLFGDTASHKAPIQYTATEDCCIIFTFSSADKADTEYTDGELAALNEGLITVRISPEE